MNKIINKYEIPPQDFIYYDDFRGAIEAENKNGKYTMPYYETLISFRGDNQHLYQYYLDRQSKKIKLTLGSGSYTNSSFYITDSSKKGHSNELVFYSENNEITGIVNIYRINDLIDFEKRKAQLIGQIHEGWFGTVTADKKYYACQNINLETSFVFDVIRNNTFGFGTGKYIGVIRVSQRLPSKLILDNLYI